jgi:predicted Rossmann fold flavoprotein
VYPLSNSAANVTNLLEARLIESGVEIQYNSEVNKIQVEDNGFQLFFSRKQPNLVCDRLVIASGGKAYPNLGSDGKLLDVIRRLGHKINPVYPALAPVLLDMKVIHGLQGLRMNAGLEIWKNEKRLGETRGNIIFTNWGLNGPGAMDLSHLVSLYGPGEMYMVINMISGIEERIRELFEENQYSKIPIRAILGAFLQPKAANFAAASMQINPETPMGSLGTEKQMKVLKHLECLRVDIKGIKGFNQCQASTGGVSLDEVDPVTMQSRLIPGLYFAGEVLDVVGPCGGYNLHWAFSSGICAGASAQLTS